MELAAHQLGQRAFKAEQFPEDTLMKKTTQCKSQLALMNDPFETPVLRILISLWKHPHSNVIKGCMA